jgi:hypothetical protein
VLNKTTSKKIHRAKTPRRKEKYLLILRTSRALRPFDVAQGMLCASHRCFRLHRSEWVNEFQMCLASFIPSDGTQLNGHGPERSKSGGSA